MLETDNVIVRYASAPTQFHVNIGTISDLYRVSQSVNVDKIITLQLPDL